MFAAILFNSAKTEVIVTTQPRSLMELSPHVLSLHMCRSKTAKYIKDGAMKYCFSFALQ